MKKYTIIDDSEFIFYVTKRMLLEYDLDAGDKKLISLASIISRQIKGIDDCDPMCRIVITYFFLTKMVNDELYLLDWLCWYFNIEKEYFKKKEKIIFDQYLKTPKLFTEYLYKDLSLTVFNNKQPISCPQHPLVQYP